MRTEMCASAAMSSMVTLTNPWRSNSRRAAASNSEAIISVRFARSWSESDGVSESCSLVGVMVLQLDSSGMANHQRTV